MIDIEVLIGRCPGLERRDLEHWIAEEWVRPDPRDGDFAFREIDVARVRLILELRDQMGVNETALPVVLLLLDQLYDLRRQWREWSEAFGRVAPGDIQRNLAAELARRANPQSSLGRSK